MYCIRKNFNSLSFQKIQKLGAQIVVAASLAVFWPNFLAAQDAVQPKTPDAPTSSAPDNSPSNDSSGQGARNASTANGDMDLFLSAGEWTLPDPVFSDNDVRFLPNGGHTASLLEYWFPPIILSNPDTGGFSMLENHNVAMRGESALWQRYYINGLNVTNPALPGVSMIRMPQHLWKNLAVQSVLTPYAQAQGFNWFLRPAQKQNEVYISNPGFLGGDSWMGTGIFDREPAESWGANPNRRRFGLAFEGDVFYRLSQSDGVSTYLFYEGISHERTFTRLSDYEKGYGNTLYASAVFAGGDQVNVFYQGVLRDYNGIETGYAPSLTTSGGSNAFYADWQAKRQSWNIGVNAGYYNSRYEQNSSDIMVWSLYDEILYGVAPAPEDVTGWFIGGAFTNDDLPTLWKMPFGINIQTRIEGSQIEPLYADSAFARTYKGSAYDITVYDSNGPYSQYITRLYPSANLTHKWSDWTANFNAGLQIETGGGDTGILIYRLEPVASASITGKLKKWTLQAGVLHDAVPLNMQEVTFLNPSSSSGGRYFWNDNGDLIAQTSEKGSIINRTGGKYHSAADNLKTPVKEELYLRSTFHASPSLDLSLSLHGKVFQNLYTVNFASGYDDGYYSITRPGVTGNTLYNRDPAKFGTEQYALDNQTSNGYYAAMHFQLLKYSDEKSPWFFNVLFGGYYAEAVTVAGNGPDFNDPGRFSESGADPNHKINTRARTDFDRGYVTHFIFGFRLFPGFTYTNVFRYRDGEAFGELMVAEGLSQGPTIVQNQERSSPPEGMPRFTYAMQWDIRLAYQKVWNNRRLGVYFDIYNLLDSRAELYEYTIRNEKWRDSMEMGIGRSYRASVSYAW